MRWAKGATQPILNDCIACEGWGDRPSCRLCGSEPKWTYPGDIHEHMKSAHGIDTVNLGRAGAEAVHSRMHNRNVKIHPFAKGDR